MKPTELSRRRRGRPAGKSAQLSSEQILSAAAQLAQRQGQLPSVRQVANVLQVDPMAIYHYFPSKQLMLEGLVMTLMDSLYTPSADGPWKRELNRLAKSYITLLTCYPGLLQTILSMTAAGPVHLFNGRFFDAVATLHASRRDKRQLLYLLVDYIHGVVFASQCAPGLELDEMHKQLTRTVNLVSRGLAAN